MFGNDTIVESESHCPGSLILERTTASLMKFYDTFGLGNLHSSSLSHNHNFSDHIMHSVTVYKITFVPSNFLDQRSIFLL